MTRPPASRCFSPISASRCRNRSAVIPTGFTGNSTIARWPKAEALVFLTRFLHANRYPLRSKTPLALRSRPQQRIQIDIDQARRPDVTDFEGVGLEPVFYQPDFLDADQVLPRIRNDEAGGRRPDVRGVGISEIPALVHVAAGDEPQIDGVEHPDQALSRRHRNVAYRCCREFGIVR